ncbi:MAG: serine--tRNA ligase [Rhodospirillales bacterium]|nr:serine--tRNA ligase [Rhodospirillales bacterium]
MLDIKWIRDHAEAFDVAMARRGLVDQARALIALDQQRRDAVAAAQAIQAERNAAAKAIGAAKARGEDAAPLIEAVARSKQQQGEAEERARAAEAELEAALALVPNLPAADVPDGADETANVEVRRWGEPRAFAFAPREHDGLGEALGLMDFTAAGRLAGARFVVLKGAFARLERALAAFMLDLHTSEFGYTEVNPPALVRDEAMFGTGQLPKFAEELFRTTDGRWLIPTAEVPLTNLAAGQILDAATLPLRFTAMTWCFRAEAGAAGKDTRGMIRQHQFSKVELVSITTPEASPAEHERMTGCAETVLQRLGLPYRVIVLCTGDMGFAARKTYDIEVWLPGQGRYREISSCSDCGDFQARRMDARYRVAGEKGTRHVHTLNGSGLAVGRTLIAVLENYQQDDGSIVVPDPLVPYMGGLTRIGPSP